jgi:hypothetical protein
LKTLCFSHEEVSSIENFIAEIVNDEILFMNTNLGLEVFYIANTDLNKLLLSALQVITGSQEEKMRIFEKSHYVTQIEIKNRIARNFILLNSMPFPYKCYVQSLFKQLAYVKEENINIIFELIPIWESILSTENISKNNRTLFIDYLNNYLSKNKDTDDQIGLIKYLALLSVKLSRRS